MPKKICPLCNAEFYTTSTKKFCDGPHYSTCEVCGSQFKIVDPVQPNRTCSTECRKLLRKQNIASKPRKCKLCGKIFYSTSNTAVYCNENHYRPCPICGKPVLILLDDVDTERCCSQECRSIQREHTCLDKYNVRVASQAPEAKQKLHDKAVANTESRKKAVQAHYGPEYTNVGQVPEIRQKISESVNSLKCIEQTKQTNLSRIGYAYAMQCPELRAKQSRNSKHQSSLEIRLHNMLDEMNIEYIEHHILTDGTHSHEFDFYLPKYNILVDCDGVYWHAYLEDPDGQKTREDYDDVRVSLVPSNSIFILIVESDFERGIRTLQRTIQSIDTDAFDYDSELFKWCRSVGFPYPNYTDKRLNTDYTNLCKHDVLEYNPYCRVGISAIRQFHKSIYHSYVKGHVSPYEAWQSDELLKKCIANRLIYQNDVDPAKVLNGFNISKIAPKVSVFNPMLARYLTLKYLNEYDEVFDPFSGFSGRMLGVCSTGKHYVGQDISDITVSESNEIINYFSLNATVVSANVFDTLDSDYSCLLTCPPYSDKESYDNHTECLTCDDWIDYILQHFNCSRYVFVVDETSRYELNVVETLPNKSHFSNNQELVIVI